MNSPRAVYSSTFFYAHNFLNVILFYFLAKLFRSNRKNNNFKPLTFKKILTKPEKPKVVVIVS